MKQILISIVLLYSLSQYALAMTNDNLPLQTINKPLSQINNLNDCSKLQLTIEKNKLDSELMALLIKHSPEEIKKLLPILMQETDNELYRLAKPSLLLLVGQPGVGKSMLSRAIAEYCNIDYAFISAPAIPNEYKNSGITRLTDLFNQLFLYKGKIIVGLDELTGMTDKQAMGNNPDVGMIQHFLTLLDQAKQKHNITIIATVNDCKTLPAPLKSRFHGSIIIIGSPKICLIEDILNLYLRKHRAPSLTDKHITFIAKKIKNYSAREIENIIKLAAIQAIYNKRTSITFEDVNIGVKFMANNRSLTTQSNWPTKEQLEPYAKIALGCGLHLLAAFIEHKFFNTEVSELHTILQEKETLIQELQATSKL